MPKFERMPFSGPLSARLMGMMVCCGAAVEWHSCFPGVIRFFVCIVAVLGPDKRVDHSLPRWDALLGYHSKQVVTVVHGELCFDLDPVAPHRPQLRKPRQP